MPPKAVPLPTEQPPIIPALLLILTTASWFALEVYTTWGFDHGLPNYDWRIESLSDLGVDYRQVHPLKHYNVNSNLFTFQNINFIQTGVLFALAQIILLVSTRTKATQQNSLLRTIRLLTAVFYAAGMILMAQVHGGPREKHWKIIGWHWTGFALAAVSGNINSILTSTASTVGSYELSPLYRFVSSALGGFGLFSFYKFQTLGTWNYQTKVGLWQRGAVYPVLAWNVVTAIAILVQRKVDDSAKGKKV